MIKGTFKDHLVDWVVLYIEKKHSKPRARAILADIDRRYVESISRLFQVLTSMLDLQ